jgi:hypothetical protein
LRSQLEDNYVSIKKFNLYARARDLSLYSYFHTLCYTKYFCKNQNGGVDKPVKRKGIIKTYTRAPTTVQTRQTERLIELVVTLRKKNASTTTKKAEPTLAVRSSTTVASKPAAERNTDGKTAAEKTALASTATASSPSASSTTNSTNATSVSDALFVN